MGREISRRLESVEDICVVAKVDVAYADNSDVKHIDETNAKNLSHFDGKYAKETTYFDEKASKNANFDEINVKNPHIRVVENENIKSAKYADINDVKEPADVVLDFSCHRQSAATLNFALSRNISCIIAATGHTDDEKEYICLISQYIPVFFTSNLSPAIAILSSYTAKLAGVFDNADVEIVEAHHSSKTDVPSGTALMLANAVRSARNHGEIHVGRHTCGARKKGEIGVHSLRLGNTFGEHEVRINTGNETIILKHIAHSRALYAEGAERAVRFIIDKSAGLYTVFDIISD